MTSNVFSRPFSRRRFVLGATGAIAASVLPRSSLAAAVKHAGSNRNELRTLQGPVFDLGIGYKTVNFTGRQRSATTVNGGLPGPTLRWREGDDVVIRVTNRLTHDSSIHWHGMILPSTMDGVPGLSFDGIAPGESFTYRFRARQSGTYWYHSHSGFQEQTGLYGAVIIDPATPDAIESDRDYVILLSDWTDEAPEQVYATLKKESHYYNRQRRTLRDLFSDAKKDGWRSTVAERRMWNQMRMSDTDLADVTGYTYTFLMNGNTPDRGWLGLFQPGEKIRLRFINAAAMTIFDVRIPGLKMTAVAADGQAVQPVAVDEFRIGAAETYDVIVEPDTDGAYTIFAQSMDRSGYARGTLATTPDHLAEIPAMDTLPRLRHRDMGMSHEHGKFNDEHAAHGSHNSAGGRMQGATEHWRKLSPAGFGTVSTIVHAKAEFGPHVDMRAENPTSGLHDPGVGLREHQQRYNRRVLTYADLRSVATTRDRREPRREIQLHLTGNMQRYMWSFNGVPFADAEPLRLQYGERVRIVLVNDTMMTHPIHLHGLWSELETGDPNFIPRKHTVLVQPGSSISYLVTADAEGRWAFHCHLLYHMAGMMREVIVSKQETGTGEQKNDDGHHAHQH